VERLAAIEAVLNQCLEDKDTVEVPRGSNRGARVQQMLRYCGLPGGYAWCAAALAAWGVEALAKLWPVPKTADCDRILSWARAKGVLHTSGPQRGDIFLVMRSRNDAIHTGIVSSVIDEDTLWTWEGNTNDGGSREGHKVAFRRRSRHNLWYVRWADALPKQAGTLPDEAETKAIEPPISFWKLWVSPHGYFPVVETRQGRPCSPIRPLVASILGISLEATSDVVGWDADERIAMIGTTPLPGTYLKGSTGWAPVREIAEALGCVVGTGGGSKQQPQRVVTVGPAPAMEKTPQ
jgi:hypothetical protein